MVPYSVLYVLVILALLVLAVKVPRARWVALTLAVLAVVLPALIASAFYLLLVLAFSHSARIG